MVLERKDKKPDGLNINVSFKDTRRQKTPLNEALALVKSMNVYICVVGTSN